MGSIPVATTTPVNRKALHDLCGAFLFYRSVEYRTACISVIFLNKNHPTEPGDFCWYMKYVRRLTAYCFVNTIVYDVGVG